MKRMDIAQPCCPWTAQQKLSIRVHVTFLHQGKLAPTDHASP
jgi:hypothetical protein